MTDYILVLCTINDSEKAKEIARKIVKSKLCACVNIVPDILSVYSWKNKIEEDSEILMLIKTHKQHFPKLKDEIVKLHPYEVPEIISFDITDGNKEYLHWISENTQS